MNIRALQILAFAIGFVLFSQTQRLPAQGFRVPEAVEAYDQGKTLMEQEQYAEAAGAFSKAISLDDAYADAYLLRGQAYLELEDYDDAVKSFRDAIDRNRDLAAAFHGRGQAYRELQSHDLALDDFNRAVELEWNNKQYYLDLGSMQRILGKTQSIRSLDRAIELDNDFAEAYDERGQAYAGLGKYDDAESDLKNALRLAPGERESWFHLGALYLGQKEFVDAVKSFGKALDIEAKDEYVEARIARAVGYLQIGNESDSANRRAKAYQAAIADCDLALESNLRQPTAWFYRGIAFRMLQQYGDAVESLTEAIRLNPEFGEAYFRRGIVWYYLDEPALALIDFQHSSSINHQDVRAVMWQGFSYAKQEKYYLAVRAYGHALEKNELHRPAFDNRGLAYLRLGEYEKAIDNFNQTLRLEPNDARAYFKRGVAQELLGRHQRAIVSYSAALQFNPNFSAVHRRLANLYQSLGEPDRAVYHRTQSESSAEGRAAE